MTAYGRRGNPTLNDPAVRQAFLEAVADGMHIGPASQHVGIGPDLSRRHAATDPTFAADLKQARAQGKKHRDDAKDHSEGHYRNQQCRHPACIKASNQARTNRRQRARQQPETEPGDVHPIPLPMPEPALFPLARAS
ncbi:hypothetical protein ACFQ6Q_00265 [Streptomyces sp. NPDC056437]|uniref:hypothetical protein n=1 Tax=Streptomyces sp. NPDC056437 TaxID=3345816 RepID=UPI0036803315